MEATTDNTKLTAGLDLRAAAWEVSDELLRRVQESRTDLNWNEQLELVDELMAEVGLA
jgi:hypothetical protein